MSKRLFFTVILSLLVQTAVSNSFAQSTCPEIIDDDGNLWDSTVLLCDGSTLTASQAQLYRAYRGGLGRLPDTGGYEWWSVQIQAGNHTLDSMLAGFIWSAEFLSKLGVTHVSDIENGAFLSYVYTNVFGRAPDQAGLDWWKGTLDTNQKTLAEVLRDMTQSNEYVEATYADLAHFFGEADPQADCEPEQFSWNGAIYYELDGQLSARAGDCTDAEVQGNSFTFATEDDRTFASFGSDAIVRLPDQLGPALFAEDSFEMQFQLRVPDEVSFPQYQVVISARSGWTEQYPGLAVIVHGETFGTQLIVTFNDNGASMTWVEFAGLIERGQWHDVQLVFDLLLEEFHLIVDGEEFTRAFPAGFDSFEFAQALQQRTVVLGGFDGSKSDKDDPFDLDRVAFHAPAQYELDVDSDRDGVIDQEDDFPNDPNESRDSDGDGIGDNADPDDDDDGTFDVEDAFPSDPNESRDSDSDGIGNNADPDDDNDGTADVDDPFPSDPNESRDSDGDGIGDNADPDDDNDGTADVDDGFPNDPSESRDSDGDGIGDNADPDDDNDGTPDVDDAFPNDPNESRDSDGDGIGDNADPDNSDDGGSQGACEFGQFSWNGAIYYELDGQLSARAGDCTDAEVQGNSFTFATEDDRTFASFGSDAIVRLPDQLGPALFAEDSFEMQFQLRVPDEVSFPQYQVVISARSGWTEQYPGLAVIVHGETFGTQLIVTFNDNGASMTWVEFAGLIERGQWHDVQLVFDLLLEEFHLIVDGEEFTRAFPAGFDSFEFAQALQQRTVVLGGFDGSKSDKDDPFDLDRVAFHAPAQYELDVDSDRDGVIDQEDDFPNDPNESRDSDGDGIGDNADPDDDDDGTFDVEDAFPSDPSESRDSDGDGIGDNADPDDDNDGTPDVDDDFPNDPNESRDSDGDGIGNNADPDDDNDGTADADDEFPLNPDLVRQTDRSPQPALPAETDRSFNVAWTPSLAGECSPYANSSPSLAPTTERLAELNEGRRVFEPEILFSDETTTFLIRMESSESMLPVRDLLGGYDWIVEDHSGEMFVHDDGTHGDIEAGDGVYTRSCLSVAPIDFDGASFVGRGGVFIVNSQLRGTESVETIAEGVRINDSGLFVSLGDQYRLNLDRHWNLFTVGNCYACQYAWHLIGDVFDVFLMTPREAVGGAGFMRVHDFIEGTGHNPPFDHFSYHNRPMVDEKEHAEYIGMLWMGWPPLSGFSHELGHALLGINTADFPGEGDRQWNAGDGQHIDSDGTVRGDLQGPLWDPGRGWPYPVRLNDGSDHPWEFPEVYVDVDENGGFYLKEMDADRFIWSDIFLYMMGLITPSESYEVYYKLIGPLYGDCEQTEQYFICNDTTLNASQVVEYSISDMVDRYGPWKSNVPSFDPTLLKVGVLHVSDRLHTEAEIIMLSRPFRSYVEPGRQQVEGSDEYTWWWTTQGKANVKIDFTDSVLPDADE